MLRRGLSVSRTLKRDKKLVFAPADAVRRLMEIANRQGKPFYTLVSEILEQALEAHSVGVSLKELLESYSYVRTHSACGIALVPREVIVESISKLNSSEKERFDKEWRKLGEKYGQYASARFKDPLKFFEGLLRKGGLWDLNEVSIEENEGVVRVRCVCPVLSVKETDILLNFVDGVMRACNYRSAKHDVMKGIVALEYTKT